MVNQAYLDDKKIKDILTYISGMRHSEQIRTMFFCSLNGIRSINFCYLQIKDIYNNAFKCCGEYQRLGFFRFLMNALTNDININNGKI